MTSTLDVFADPPPPQQQPPRHLQMGSHRLLLQAHQLRPLLSLKDAGSLHAHHKLEWGWQDLCVSDFLGFFQDFSSHIPSMCPKSPDSSCHPLHALTSFVLDPQLTLSGGSLWWQCALAILKITCIAPFLVWQVLAVYLQVLSTLVFHVFITFSLLKFFALSYASMDNPV